MVLKTKTANCGDVFCIAGPTASGKSVLALDMALCFESFGKKALIINADSQQVYKELPIVSAQPSLSDKARIDHRLYGCWDASTIGSAGMWALEAASLIKEAWEKKIIPIVCGGTGFYIMALLEGLRPVPDISETVRLQAIETLNSLGVEAFYQVCGDLDPQSVASIEANDTHRLLRLWEVYHGTGKPLSFWRKEKPAQVLPRLTRWHKVLLLPDRDKLYETINKRVESMVKRGAVEEVDHLLGMQLPKHHPLMKAVGVQEIHKYRQGEQSYEEMVQKFKQYTRNFAKRQITWFKNQYKANHILDIGGPEVVYDLCAAHLNTR